MHNGFINVNNEKMSKSLGNFFTVRDIVKSFDYEVIRFFMLCVHYRNPINFSDELLGQSKNGLERLYNCLDNLDYLGKNPTKDTPDFDEEKFKEKLLVYKAKFIEAMDDDLNTADAIAVLFDMVREINTSITAASGASGQTIDFSANLLRELGNVLGILQKREDQNSIDTEVEELINQRQQARKEKNWKLADEIRDKLKSIGIILEDTPQGGKMEKGIADFFRKKTKTAANLCAAGYPNLC